MKKGKIVITAVIITVLAVSALMIGLPELPPVVWFVARKHTG